jgi:hypothetical protein
MQVSIAALLKLLLVISPPLGEPMKQAQRLLRSLVEGHFVFVFATLLSKGAGTVVDPFVTIDLGSAMLSR